MSNSSESWIVVGAGLCGLAACLELERQGHSCLLLEETSQIGGKLKTELVGGQYLLDHGFQVLLPAYTELRRVIDLDTLDLKYFKAGAMVRVGTDWIRISDPLRDPSLILETIFSDIGTLKDKLLVLKLQLSVLSRTNDQFFEQSLGSTLDYLKEFGFSQGMIDKFWGPFFSGIFLESELQTEATFFRFLFKMFSQSPVALPANGVGQLPKALFSKLRRTELRLNTSVKSVNGQETVLTDGTRLRGPVIDTRSTVAKSWGSVTTLYFAAKTSPIRGPWLMLSAKSNGTLVNHVAVLTEVSKQYAANGDALISVNLLRANMSEQDFLQVKRELKDMFGEQTLSWRFLKAFEIPKALPLYLSVPGSQEKLHTPSQQGALLRGRHLVERRQGM